MMCPQLKTSNQLATDWGLATTLRSRKARCDAQVERTDFGICLINVVGGGDQTTEDCLGKADAASVLLMSAA